jgi:preprotein translocase subunit YajC
MTPVDTAELVLAQAGPRGGGIEAMLPLVLILVVFYFLLVRPQQTRAREHKQLVEALKKNDQVVTTGGLHGRIVDVADDTITLEIAANVVVRHERSQVASVTGKTQKEKKGRTGA